MPDQLSLVVFTAIGTIILYCKWGPKRTQTLGLSVLLDLWTTEQTKPRRIAELVIFVALGCTIAMGVVAPTTPIQALAAGLSWTGLLATAK